MSSTTTKTKKKKGSSSSTKDMLLQQNHARKHRRHSHVDDEGEEKKEEEVYHHHQSRRNHQEEDSDGRRRNRNKTTSRRSATTNTNTTTRREEDDRYSGHVDDTSSNPPAFRSYSTGFFNTLNHDQRHIGDRHRHRHRHHRRHRHRHHHDGDRKGENDNGDNGSADGGESGGWSSSSSFSSAASRSFMSNTYGDDDDDGDDLTLGTAGTADTGLVSKIGQGVMNLEEQVSHFFSVGGENDEDDGDDDDDDDDDTSPDYYFDNSGSNSGNYQRDRSNDACQNKNRNTKRDPMHDGDKFNGDGDVLLEVSSVTNAVISERALYPVDGSGRNRNGNKIDKIGGGDPNRIVDVIFEDFDNSITKNSDSSSGEGVESNETNIGSRNGFEVNVPYVDSDGFPQQGSIVNNDGEIYCATNETNEEGRWARNLECGQDVTGQVAFMSFDDSDIVVHSEEATGRLEGPNPTSISQDVPSCENEQRNDGFYHDWNNTEVDINEFRRVASLEFPRPPPNTSSVFKGASMSAFDSPRDNCNAKLANHIVRALSFTSGKQHRTMLQHQSQQLENQRYQPFQKDDKPEFQHEVLNSSVGQHDDDEDDLSISRTRSWIERVGLMKSPRRERSYVSTSDHASPIAPTAVVSPISSDVVELVDPRYNDHDLANITKSSSVLDLPSLDLDASRDREANSSRAASSEVRNQTNKSSNARIVDIAALEISNDSSSSDQMIESSNDLSDRILLNPSRVNTIQPDLILNDLERQISTEDGIKCLNNNDSRETAHDYNNSNTVPQSPTPQPNLQFITMALSTDESIEYDTKQWELTAKTVDDDDRLKSRVKTKTCFGLGRSAKKGIIDNGSQPVDSCAEYEAKLHVVRNQSHVETKNGHVRFHSVSREDPIEMEFQQHRSRWPWRRDTKVVKINSDNHNDPSQSSTTFKISSEAGSATTKSLPKETQAPAKSSRPEGQTTESRISSKVVTPFTKKMTRSFSLSRKRRSSDKMADHQSPFVSHTNLADYRRSKVREESDSSQLRKSQSFTVDHESFAVKLHSTANDGSVAHSSIAMAQPLNRGGVTLQPPTKGSHAAPTRHDVDMTRPDPPSSSDFVSTSLGGNTAVFERFVQGAKETLSEVQAGVTGILVDSLAEVDGKQSAAGNGWASLRRASTRQISNRAPNQNAIDGRVPAEFHSKSVDASSGTSPETKKKKSSAVVSHSGTPTTERSADSSLESTDSTSYEPPSLVHWLPEKYTSPKSAPSKSIKQKAVEDEKPIPQPQQQEEKQQRRSFMARKKIQNHARRGGSLLFLNQRRSKKNKSKAQDEDEDEEEKLNNEQLQLDDDHRHHKDEHEHQEEEVDHDDDDDEDIDYGGGGTANPIPVPVPAAAVVVPVPVPVPVPAAAAVAVVAAPNPVPARREDGTYEGLGIGARMALDPRKRARTVSVTRPGLAVRQPTADVTIMSDWQGAVNQGVTLVLNICKVKNGRVPRVNMKRIGDTTVLTALTESFREYRDRQSVHC